MKKNKFLIKKKLVIQLISGSRVLRSVFANNNLNFVNDINIFKRPLS